MLFLLQSLLDRRSTSCPFQRCPTCRGRLCMTSAAPSDWCQKVLAKESTEWLLLVVCTPPSPLSPPSFHLYGRQRVDVALSSHFLLHSHPLALLIVSYRERYWRAVEKHGMINCFIFSSFLSIFSPLLPPSPLPPSPLTSPFLPLSLPPCPPNNIFLAWTKQTRSTAQRAGRGEGRRVRTRRGCRIHDGLRRHKQKAKVQRREWGRGRERERGREGE